MMKIAVFSTKKYDIQYLSVEAEKYKYDLEYFETSLKPSTARLAKGFEVVCAFVNDKLNCETLDILSENGIKLIALRCAGFNNVDLEAAAKYGLKVMRVPSYSPQAVAEHATALILALNRKIHKAYNRVRDANFSLERLVGFDLINKKVGILGTGKIGQAFADIMRGFACEIIAYDPYPEKALIDKGVVYASLEEVFENSDILSLHCPLTHDTFQVVNKGTLQRMKKGAMLINTSRGKLINTDDVLSALRSKHLGYLGMDVYAEEEKLFFRDLSERIIDDEKIMQLMSFPNVLITAHQGFLTAEALTEIATTTMKNISVFSKGESNENEVTSELII